MSSVTSATQTSSSSPASAASSLASQAADSGSIQNEFLTMLVAQLNNQDPLNPMDDSQITAQMAQISTVSGIEQLNTTMQSLQSQTNASQQIDASSLVGHEVLVNGSSIALGTNGGVGGFTLTQDVDSLTVSVKDANGNVVHSVNLGQQKAGMQTFQWDGNNDSGLAEPQGNYTFTINALSGGQPVQVQGLELGTVNGVLPGTAGASLDLGAQGTALLSDVKQIF